jgi:hypothetical protein
MPIPPPISYTWTFRYGAEIMARFTSIERMLEGVKTMPIEPPTVRKDALAKVPPSTWPARGEIVFENVSARYACNRSRSALFMVHFLSSLHT